MRSADFYRVLVAVETDPTQYYGTGARRPALLSAADAEQMLAHLAADLQALLPAIASCSLVAAGALFDQTQLLQPGYPVFRALEATAVESSGARFSPGLVSIGARGQKMPMDELQPSPTVPLGSLQLLPMLIRGPEEQLSPIATAMEHRFLEQGQLSAHSATWLQTAFGVTIHHARFMTLTDLSAMLRLQLEHFGFLPLWELLDAALSGNPQPLEVITAGGRSWKWAGGAAHTDFETFDHWANEGPGRGLGTERMALAASYADWTRELRQYLITLRAHGLKVKLHAPGEAEPLTGSYLKESSDLLPGSDVAAVTEHSFDDLGTIAVTVVEGDRVENFYPLSSGGLNDIHAVLRGRVPSGHTVAFPGTILYDPGSRCLCPEEGAVSTRH